MVFLAVAMETAEAMVAEIREVRSNKALQRTSGYRGRTVRACMCALGGAQSASCLAAEIRR